MINRYGIVIAVIMVFLFSCNGKEEMLDDTKIQEAILAENSFKDSNFVLTEFKQGKFNLRYHHDTLSVLYNSWVLILQSIPKIITADTGTLNPYEYRGTWNNDSIAGYPIVSLKNNYFKKFFLKLKKADSYNFDWKEIRKDNINGFISFSDMFSYTPDSKLIALNMYTEGKYSYSIYSIPQKSELPPRKLLTRCYSLLSINPEIENNKVKNITPEAYIIGCNN